MIKSISFHLLRVDDYHTLGNRIEEVISKMVQEDPQLQELTNQLRQNLKKLDEAYLKPTTKYLTSSVEKADERRDNAFMAYRNYLEACSRRQVEGWPEAAGLLLEVLNQHGYSLHRESYDTQTSRMNNLIGDIKSKPNLMAATETIALGPWLEEMDQANQNFETVYSQRNETTSQPIEVNSEEACRAIRENIKLLFKYIEVMVSLNIHPEYTDMVHQINGYVTQVMARLRSRKTRNENQKQEQTAETDQN
ncbi:MAG: DUF6261 family protein [Marinifilaceae bacterium]